jgi:mono/diheme cytochrome c family protein
VKAPEAATANAAEVAVESAAMEAATAMETTAATVEATAATATAEGHCAGCHRSSKSQGHRTRDKLFAHETLLRHFSYSISGDQHEPWLIGCIDGAPDRLK